MPASSRVTQNPLWGSLTSLREALKNLPVEFANQQGEMVSRARALTDELTERLENGIDSLLADQALNNAQGWVSVMLSEIQAAVAQNNPAAIAQGTNFFNHLDALAANLHTFPIAQPVATLNSAVEEAQRRLQTLQDLNIAQEANARAAKDQIQRLIKEAEDAKTAGKERLDEQEKAASALLAALGASATSSGYAVTADAEAKQADTWRKITLGGGLFTAVAAVVLLLTVEGQSIADVATRLGVTTPAILLTVYAGKQSSGHRSEERKAKRLELAFGSVNAYLADLDLTKRADLKSRLSSQLFAADSDGGGPPGDYPSTADLMGVVNELVKRIR